MDTTDIRTATMTLLVYKATIELDGAGPIVSFSLAPDSARLTLSQTATGLAALAKPIDCTARRERSNLAIMCKPIEDTRLLQMRAQFVAYDVSSLSRQMQMSGRSAHNPDLIELRAGSDRLVLSLQDYSRWKSDYNLSSPHAIGGDHPPPGYSDGRIGFVLEVVDGSGVDVRIDSH